jgi:hypothetical protein
MNYYRLFFYMLDITKYFSLWSDIMYDNVLRAKV